MEKDDEFFDLSSLGDEEDVFKVEPEKDRMKEFLTKLSDVKPPDCPEEYKLKEDSRHPILGVVVATEAFYKEKFEGLCKELRNYCKSNSLIVSVVIKKIIDKWENVSELKKPSKEKKKNKRLVIKKSPFLEGLEKIKNK